MGNEIKKRGLIDWRATYKRAEEILQSVNLNIDVRQPMGQLSAAMQQMVAIALAVSLDAKLIIMDEATSSLDDKEVQSLLNIVKELQKKNIAIIFITHRMNEIYEVCERCTVLKDGEFIGCYDLDKLPKLELISKMVGRDASTIVNFKKQYNSDIESNEVICEFKNVAQGLRLKNIEFEPEKRRGSWLCRAFRLRKNRNGRGAIRHSEIYGLHHRKRKRSTLCECGSGNEG